MVVCAQMRQASHLGQVTFCLQIIVGSVDGRLTSYQYPKQAFLTLMLDSALQLYIEFLRILC